MASSTKAHHPFDFHAKISKKVAELTVVVHMLFKRNHEKEVEYEYFKMVAEQEMNKIKEQHQQKIEWLEKQLDEQEAYRAKVEYQLGDMNDLKEKISQLEQANENTKQQVKTKEELLSVANLEIDVLKQKIQSYEEDVEGMKIKPQEAKPPDKPLLRAPGDQERISKSATQLNVPSQLPEKRTEEMEAMIKRLEDEIAELKRKHENEITKSYTEKMGLQKKIDGYTSSLSQEIDELKQTLNILSSKQVDDQKKLAEVDKEKKRVEENLKKSEAEKKQLQRDAKILRDQLKNAIKNNHITKKNLLAFRDAISQGGPKQRLFDSRDEELERLRKEVQMYRMELENREDNFNRMFADKQPVILGQQPDRYLVERNLTGTRRKRPDHLPKLKDQRSLTFVSGFNQQSYQL